MFGRGDSYLFYCPKSDNSSKVQLLLILNYSPQHNQIYSQVSESDKKVSSKVKTAFVDKANLFNN